jgi:hypothetical protein
MFGTEAKIILSLSHQDREMKVNNTFFYFYYYFFKAQTGL